MKATSAAYREQMASTGRNHSNVRIFYKQIDSLAAGDGTYADNGAVAYSEKSSVDTGYLPTATYAALEQDRFLLDGTQRLLPDSAPYQQEGFVSLALSDASGAFEINPIVTKTFVQKHSIIGMTLTFDSVLNEYPKHIVVRFYNNDLLVQSISLESISASVVVIERRVPSFDKYSIEFVKMVLPYRRARLQSVMYGIERVFDDVIIEKTEQSTDIDPISRRLPTETFSFTIFDLEQRYNPENPNGEWEYIDVQSPVAIQYGYELNNGTIEWLAPDAYLLDGRPTVGDNRATFRATGLIGYMTDTYYKGTTGLKSLYDMAAEVLLDADLPLTDALENPWYIDPALDEIHTTAVLPIDTHRNCLQLIAHAGMCKLYTDSNGIVRLERMELPEATEDYTLNFSSAMTKPTVTKIEPLYGVNVLKYTGSIASATSEIHKSTFAVDGNASFYAEFTAAQDVAINIVGGSLSDINIYARAVTAAIEATGEVTVTITGKQITTSASGMPYVVSSDNRGETEIIENPLVTEDEHKKALEQHIADYLAFRVAYSLDYRGSPELQTGDLIYLQSQFTPKFPAMVLKHVVSYNGGLRASGIFKGVWFKMFRYDYAGEIYAGEFMGVI